MRFQDYNHDYIVNYTLQLRLYCVNEIMNHAAITIIKLL